MLKPIRRNGKLVGVVFRQPGLVVKFPVKNGIIEMPAGKYSRRTLTLASRGIEGFVARGIGAT